MIYFTDLRQSTLHQQAASASASAPALASADATSGQASDLPSLSSDFCHPSTKHVGQSPGSHQYAPAGSTNHCGRHTLDVTPKTEQWTTFGASFNAAVAVGSHHMPEAQKLLMLINLLSGEPKEIARRIAEGV